MEALEWREYFFPVLILNADAVIGDSQEDMI
jgi:hypothetical protein